MATTLERAAFAKPLLGSLNLKFVDASLIAVGNTVTVTLADGNTLAGTVTKLLPYGAASLQVTTCSKVSGLLLLPKGSAVA